MDWRYKDSLKQTAIYMADMWTRYGKKEIVVHMLTVENAWLSIPPTAYVNRGEIAALCSMLFLGDLLSEQDKKELSEKLIEWTIVGSARVEK